MQTIDIRSFLKDPNLFKEAGFINGHWVNSPDTFAVANPATNEHIASVSNLNSNDAAKAIEAAESALSAWHTKLGKERAHLMRKWFDLIIENTQDLASLMTLEQGKPLVFGNGENKGIKLDGFKPVIVDLAAGASKDDLWIHDEKDFYKAQILVRMFDDPRKSGHLPRPFGVFFETERQCYEDAMSLQIEDIIASKGKGDLNKLLRGKEVWEIV